MNDGQDLGASDAGVQLAVHPVRAGENLAPPHCSFFWISAVVFLRSVDGSHTKLRGNKLLFNATNAAHRSFFFDTAVLGDGRDAIMVTTLSSEAADDVGLRLRYGSFICNLMRVFNYVHRGLR